MNPNEDYELNLSNLRKPGYSKAIIRRTQDTSISSFLVLMFIGYGIFMVIKYISDLINLKVKAKLVSKGINYFQENEDTEKRKGEQIQFSDLVPVNDVIFSKSLFHLQQGREVGSKEVTAMHKSRLDGLVRNLKRELKREKGKMSFDRVATNALEKARRIEKNKHKM